ncbi:hypothetical protein Sjap_017501 [Stephania japonica]|uniref:NAC domain-containing protein n=1 Tax=Stephania japonica TaxID=461633 RepID=A0AAP0I6E8_9MAGN
MTTAEVAVADMDADVEEKLQCDFNTTHHHDVVALPNVESMVETTEVLEEEEGVDWLRDFPQFEPADLEFSDWEADAWDNEFVRFECPILLEDYHLVEKLANFDRERIPERVVHARGASAKGFFEVTHDISQLSCADFLRAPGVQTPLIVRFSTVIHERGSLETLRDPRGFFVKFYTREFFLAVTCLLDGFELLGYFLFSKIQNPTVQFEEIKDPKNIYEYVPDILTSLYERNSRANEWYFFSRVNKKHANGSRLSRSIAGQKGFWRASTGVKKVRGYNGQLLGKRTPLNYYEGKNSKTDWIMQEYILAPPQDHRTPNKFEDYALCKIYQKGSKASTSKSSIVIGHQLREISYNFNSVCAKEGLEEDYMVPQVPYYDQYINVGEAQGGTINSEEAMLPLMIVNQGHPSALVPFVPTDDNVANMGSPTILRALVLIARVIIMMCGMSMLIHSHQIFVTLILILT